MSSIYFYDGTVVHYNQPKQIRVSSLANLQKNKVRTYQMKGKIKRNLRASACYMFDTKDRGELLHFGTITFSGDVPNDELIRQEIYKKFVKNLSANYSITGYIAIKERGEKNDLIHYHIIFRSKFIKYVEINNCLNNVIVNSGYAGSANCFTTNSKGYKNIIVSIEGVLKYVTKYCSKSKGVFLKPVYFCSENIRIRPNKIVDDAEKEKRLFDQYPIKTYFCFDNGAISTREKTIYYESFKD